MYIIYSFKKKLSISIFIVLGFFITVSALAQNSGENETVTVTTSYWNPKTHLTVTSTAVIPAESVLNKSALQRTNSNILPIDNNFIKLKKWEHSLLSDRKPKDTTACPGLSGTVYIGSGTGTPSYPSFNGSGGLFEDINNKALSSDLTVIIQQKNITEPSVATLLNPVAYCKGGPYKITIQPAGDSLFTVSGTAVNPAVIGFNGAVNN
jgi:hypothetical protein